jgi:hypothetical protein
MSVRYNAVKRAERVANVVITFVLRDLCWTRRMEAGGHLQMIDGGLHRLFRLLLPSHNVSALLELRMNACLDMYALIHCCKSTASHGDALKVDFCSVIRLATSIVKQAKWCVTSTLCQRRWTMHQLICLL